MLPSGGVGDSGAVKSGGTERGGAAEAARGSMMSEEERRLGEPDELVRWVLGRVVVERECRSQGFARFSGSSHGMLRNHTAGCMLGCGIKVGEVSGVVFRGDVDPLLIVSVLAEMRKY